MIIRKMKNDEYKKAKIISSVAFEFPLDYDKLMEETENSNENNIVNDIENEVICAFSDDEKIMYSSIGVYPYEINFDGNRCMMGGIGGVSTLPPYRRNGAVRECLTHVFYSLKEKKIPLSYLYPFSCSYYRKFGYETSSTTNTWTVDFKALKKFNVGGYTEFLMPEDSYEKISGVYDKMYENYNLSVIRREKDFNYFTKRDTFNSKRYAYIWKNNEGVTKAYIIFKKETENGKNIMDCTHHFMGKNDIGFVDSEGLCALFDFALTFSSNYDAIRFTLPIDMQISDLIDEQNELQNASKHRGMVRVIDVKQVLKAARYKGNGNLKIKITDKYCPWNNDVFFVQFDENAETMVSKCNGSADICMDISTFSALIVGVYDSIKSCLKPDLQIINNKIDLDNIFYFKKNIVMDLF